MSRVAELHRLLMFRPRCGQDLVEAGIGYRYSARIYDLRALGFPIKDRPCTKHEHQAPMVEYVLEGYADKQLEMQL